jgi:hypothetical protein
MKRVRVAPGKFVTISTGLAEKVSRVVAVGLTRDQVRELASAEPRHIKMMAGSKKPLGIAKPWPSSQQGGRSAVVGKIAITPTLRRKSG